MKPDSPKGKGRREFLLPRWVIPLFWAMIVLVILILLPWAISKLGPCFGWFQQSPALWNLAGLIAVVIGIVLYAWCIAFHFRSYQASVRVGLSPPHLVIAGPYRLSRNPMYVSGLLAWVGWTVFYGSPSVLIALVLLWLVFTFRVIPQEERQLETLFGEDFIKYKRTVRRWTGLF